MKPAALESRKQQAITGIEKIVDLLLAETNLTFDQPSTPVRKPAVKSLVALERIGKKLALLAEATGISERAVQAVTEPVVSDPGEPAEAEQAEEGEPGTEEANPAEDASEEAESGEETEAEQAEE